MPESNIRSIIAPPALGLDSRVAFRDAALQELASLAPGGTLDVDLSGTRQVDSAGLSVLMLIHRSASDRGLRVTLRKASDQLRYLLALTQMTQLFELVG